MDSKTKHAIHHTLHCLLGCSIGEILGMAIAGSLHWHRIGRVSLATVLAFCFGYALTYRGIRRQADSSSEAARATLATDTVSIASMEVSDNFVEFLIPKALTVTLATPRFWWSLALSLSIAFFVTAPINRFMITRGKVHHESV